jgi:hypothetical protein
MERFARTLYDYSKDHQWVRLMGWTDAELRSVPIHSNATSHGTTGPEDDYLNLANFGATSLGVSSQGSGGGTSANVRSIENTYVYRADSPPPLYERLQRLIDEGGPASDAWGVFDKEQQRKKAP